MNVKELQEYQAEYDRSFWKHDHSDFEKIRHVTLHLGKLLGKVSNFCEAHEHGREASSDQLQTQVVPDLLVYSLQLANTLGLDLEDQYKRRLESNIQRFEESD